MYSGSGSGRQSASEDKFIHLLYAPTNFCNMGCKYCYLGEGTDEKTDLSRVVDTLKYTVNEFLQSGVTPFNLSFHGGEATAIPRDLLATLFKFTEEYYNEYGEKIKNAGFPLNPIHIKTNLYNFDKLYDLFNDYKVSVSGSVDLPLALHQKYRTDKSGKSTLDKILKNLKLLAGYPHHKKISCVVTREHLSQLEQFVADIKYIHYDIGLDMTRFNIMFSFDSDKNQEKFEEKISGTEMLNDEEQVYFYQYIRNAFKGSELEAGFNEHWFKEFTPDFCCSAVNCGDKFFLLQSNGDVYACPRGQSSRSFFYGNVYESKVTDIMQNGWKTIEALENKKEPNEECYQCNYLPYCHQGCIFVREETGLTKSYTCKLQQAIYKDNPDKYPPYDDEYIHKYSLKYRFHNNIQAIKIVDATPKNNRYITPELNDEENALANIIEQDQLLKEIYSEDMFQFSVDGQKQKLFSPILQNSRDMMLLGEGQEMVLRFRKDCLSINCNEPVNNYIHLMLLRNTMVSYGDEGRQKQEHIVDYSIYQPTLYQQSVEAPDGYYEFSLNAFFLNHAQLFMKGVRNNLVVTTKSMREYHYQKQRKNAFYHIQAINLPFPYLEFYWR